MPSVAARGSSPEERKTVSKLHFRPLTPAPGQRVVNIAKFFVGLTLGQLPLCWLPLPSLHPWLGT